MDCDIFPDLGLPNPKNTENKDDNEVLWSASVKKIVNDDVITRPLTTKVAVKLLLEGTLKSKVCRYCLSVTQGLSELDQIMNIGGTGNLYKVTLRDIVASFHPFKVVEDPNFPNKICQRCIDKALGAYFFTQQCDRAERAMLNCFEDVYEKFEKLDPIDKPKRRGRQKLNPNYNKLYVEHEKVIDYAEPIINIVNVCAESFTKEPEINEFECKKCWQVLPNLESLLNHEKMHPKTMWYHCRFCGKSFPKSNQLKKHHYRAHVFEKEVQSPKYNNFKCKECDHATNNYIVHLQHIEKHKFKNIMKHLIEKRMDRLCVVCFNNENNMVGLDNMVRMHGGHPDLTGERSLQRILASTLPNMNRLYNYYGTKICDRCLKNAITSYIFMHQFNFARERLYTCVNLMLNNIMTMVPHANVFIQISQDTIMPTIEDVDEPNFLDDNTYIDDSKLKVDVLEDEFRIKSDSEKGLTSDEDDSVKLYLNNPAKNATKTYMKKKLVNGLQNYPMDICSEFLTFNKRVVKNISCKYTCPMCNKHFISDYFLKRHILKHTVKKVKCNTCNRDFNSKFYLCEHMKMMHLLKVNNYLSCRVCGRCFMKVDKLKTHIKCHKNIICQLCGKMFATQTDYNIHIKRHADKLKIINKKQAQTCSFCEKACPNDNELSLHVNKVHLQIKPYNCDMCDRQFYTENNLKYHKKVHSMYRKEICEFCNKTLKCRKSLVIHIRKHIGAKPFICQVCGQGFYSNFKARKHMKVYHGGSFCCRICKTTFVTKCGLRDHVHNEHGFI